MEKSWNGKIMEFHMERKFSIWKENFPCGKKIFYMEKKFSIWKEKFSIWKEKFTCGKKNFPYGKIFQII